jgi:hypothetical protein
VKPVSTAGQSIAHAGLNHVRNGGPGPGGGSISGSRWLKLDMELGGGCLYGRSACSFSLLKLDMELGGGCL